MMFWLVVVALSVAVLGAGGKQVAAWFSQHEQEASNVSERFLDSPSSLKKVPVDNIFSEATKTLSIIIPAFNEQDRLPSTLDETLRYLQRRRDSQGPSFTYEVIIVDDGSRDATARVAFDYVRRHGLDAVRLLKLPRNHGKGYAVKAGMLVGRGERLLFMDADGATRVSDLEKLEAALASMLATQGKISDGHQDQTEVPAVRRVPSARESMGMVVGSRAHLAPTAVAQRAWYRNVLMHGFHVVVLLVAGGGVRDTQCGFKLFSRRAAQLLYTNQRLQRWCFDVELIYLAQRLGIPIAETPVNWTEVPGSKVSVTSVLHMTWEMAAIVIGYALWQCWAIRTPGDGGKKT